MGRDILLQLNNTIKCQRESAIARNKHAHIYTTGRWLEDKHTSLSFHLGAVLVLFGWHCWKAAPDFPPPPSTYFLLGTGNTRLSTPQINCCLFPVLDWGFFFLLFWTSFTDLDLLSVCVC